MELVQGMRNKKKLNSLRHTLSILAYLLEADARPFLSDALRFLRIAPTGHEHAKKALEFRMPDFEDAFQAASAAAFGASYIVTRNEKDYRNSPVPALSPTKFIRTLAG